MDLLANDLSVHEQFHSLATFREAFSSLMAMRDAARRYGRELHCHRALLVVKPLPEVSMQHAISGFPLESERRAAMRWLTAGGGPFWDDMRQHSGDDWLECGDEIVTESAIGEAAFRAMHGTDCGLLSFAPSNWNRTPVDVTWRRENEGSEDRHAALENWWEVAALEDALRKKVPPIQSWEELREASVNRFESLVFSDDCFAPFAGVPFAKSAADRFLALLDVLDRFSRAFDADGFRTAEGHQIYRDYFTGERALFSDSSDTEKQDFRRELTFAHPKNPQDSLFCPWHGKVSHLTLRLHFSWPVEAEESICIVYAGPKITRR